MRDNLFEPRKDGRAEGTQRFSARRSSLFLQTQKHPLIAAGIAAGGVVAAAGLIAGRRRSAATS